MLPAETGPERTSLQRVWLCKLNEKADCQASSAAISLWLRSGISLCKSQDKSYLQTLSLDAFPSCSLHLSEYMFDTRPRKMLSVAFAFWLSIELKIKEAKFWPAHFDSTSLIPVQGDNQ